MLYRLRATKYRCLMVVLLLGLAVIFIHRTHHRNVIEVMNSCISSRRESHCFCLLVCLLVPSFILLFRCLCICLSVLSTVCMSVSLLYGLYHLCRVVRPPVHVHVYLFCQWAVFRDCLLNPLVWLHVFVSLTSVLQPHIWPSVEVIQILID